MASIVKRGKKYCVIFRYKNENGETKQKWETYETEEVAGKRKKEVEYCTTLGIPPSVNIQTIGDLIETFVDNYGIFNWAPATYELKKSIITNHIVPHIGKWNLEKTTVGI